MPNFDTTGETHRAASVPSSRCSDRQSHEAGQTGAKLTGADGDRGFEARGPQSEAAGPRLPILTFHDIGSGDAAIDFNPSLFRRACEIIAGEGMRTASLTEVPSWLQEGTFPRRRLVITFDDGYRGVCEHAMPHLLRHGLTATVFLAVGLDPPSDDRRLPSLEGREMLSWAEIREMQRCGIEFGAHTCRHPNLTRLGVRDIRAEMRCSRDMIADHLGTAVTTFAYPGGRWNQRSLETARELFACACSDRLGLVTGASDAHVLHRIDTYYLRRAGLLPLLSSRWLPAYVRLRALPRRVRRLAQGGWRG